jgi:hypothetical protein
MPVFKVQGPDGQVVKVEALDEATAIRGAKEHASSLPKPASRDMQPKWGIPVIGDFVRSSGQALDAVGAAVRRNVDLAKSPPKPRLIDMIPGFSPHDQAMGALAGSVLGLAAPATEAFTRPVARGMSRAFGGTPEEADQILNTSLMGLHPAPGRIPALPPRPAPGISRPVAKGADYVARVALSAGITPEALIAKASPRPVIAAEAIGKPGQVALGALARRHGQTGDALSAAIGERRVTRGPRMQEDFAKAIGISPDAAAGDIQSLVEAGRKQAAPLYDQAYAQPAPMTPELKELLGRPSVKKAMGTAARLLEDAGENPKDHGLVVTGANEAGLPIVEASDQPTMKALDYVKRGLDDQIQSIRDPLTGKFSNPEMGRSLSTLSSHLKGALRVNPDYAAATDTASDYLSAHQAFVDGGKYTFGPQFTESQVESHLAKMAPAEREAFKGGIANKLFDLSQNNRLDPKVLSTPRVQAKLATALGPEQARALIASAEDEGAMLAFERRYGPAANSITAEMGDAMAQQDGAGVPEQMAGDFVGNLHRGPTGAFSSMLANQLKNVEAMARTGGLSVGARDEAGRLLMLPPEQLAAYLKAREASRPKLPSGVARVGYSTEGVLPPSR